MKKEEFYATMATFERNAVLEVHYMDTSQVSYTKEGISKVMRGVFVDYLKKSTDTLILGTFPEQKFELCIMAASDIISIDRAYVSPELHEHLKSCYDGYLRTHQEKQKKAVALFPEEAMARLGKLLEDVRQSCSDEFEENDEEVNADEFITEDCQPENLFNADGTINITEISINHHMVNQVSPVLIKKHRDGDYSMGYLFMGKYVLDCEGNKITNAYDVAWAD